MTIKPHLFTNSVWLWASLTLISGGSPLTALAAPSPIYCANLTAPTTDNPDDYANTLKQVVACEQANACTQINTGNPANDIPMSAHCSANLIQLDFLCRTFLPVSAKTMLANLPSISLLQDDDSAVDNNTNATADFNNPIVVPQPNPIRIPASTLPPVQPFVPSVSRTPANAYAPVTGSSTNSSTTNINNRPNTNNNNGNNNNAIKWY